MTRDQLRARLTQLRVDRDHMIRCGVADEHPHCVNLEAQIAELALLSWRVSCQTDEVWGDRILSEVDYREGVRS